jgi:type I restriction enzyme M protein
MSSQRNFNHAGATGCLFDETSRVENTIEDRGDAQDRELKRALAKIHKALRDTDANSSIVERFDETTKLLFLKLRAERLTREESAFDWDPAETMPTYAARLRSSFEAAAAEQPSLFPDRFRSLHLSDEALAAAGKILASAQLQAATQDLKGYAYEEMIRHTFDKGDHQQFFTPQSIAEFLVAAMESKLVGNVCDPACGTGGFLVELVKRNLQVPKITGLEIDERLAWVTGINLFVHGARDFEALTIPNGGSLGKQGRSFFAQFDAILTNPPFGSDFSDLNELETYTLGKGKQTRRRGILFIERCLDFLKDGGWLGIVIDEGVLSLANATDVRDLMLSRAELKAVFSLPQTAFMPYASVNTSILIMRKTKHRATGHMTFFARADNVGRKPNGELDLSYTEAGVAQLQSDLPNILSAWRAWLETGELIENDDNIFLADPLALSRGPERTENRLDFQFHHPARAAAQAALAHCSFPLIELARLCTVRNEAIVPATDLPDQVIPYTGLAHIEARSGRAHQAQIAANSLSSAVRKYYRGDILFARMRPNLRKVALIEFEKSGYASAECVVLTVNRDVKGAVLLDPFLLATLLRSDYVFGQLMHLVAGIGRPRISRKDLLTVRIPLPPQEIQASIRELFDQSCSRSESLRREAQRLTSEAGAAERSAVSDLARHFMG